jgi:GTP cyclohydrolase IA
VGSSSRIDVGTAHASILPLRRLAACGCSGRSSTDLRAAAERPVSERVSTGRTPPDRERLRRAVAEMLAALGHRELGELEGTPERVADAWIDELLSGEQLDPLEALRGSKIELGPGPHGAVVLRRLRVATMCPHHLLPSLGSATIAYLPRERAAGLGALAQVVDTLSRRLTLHETLGESIANTLFEGLEAEGALCHLALRHSCFSARGEREAEAVVETLALTGSFVDRDRPLALGLLGGSLERHRDEP